MYEIFVDTGIKTGNLKHQHFQFDLCGERFLRKNKKCSLSMHAYFILLSFDSIFRL